MRKTATTMSKIKQETINKITPYIILVTEIITFYGGAGWLLGIWNPKYPHEETGSHLVFVLLYYFGVFAFIFFMITLPPSLVEQPFTIVTAIFITTAILFFFLSQTLTDTLQLDRLNGNYLQALAEKWNRIHSVLLTFVPQTLGFISVFAVRKILRFS